MNGKAEGAYREGIRLAPQEVLPRIRLAALRGPDGGGIEILEESVQALPEAFELHFGLALWYLETGAGDRALETIRNARRILPDHAGAKALEARIESGR